MIEAAQKIKEENGVPDRGGAQGPAQTEMVDPLPLCGSGNHSAVPSSGLFWQNK